jgi:hypothetical protein
MSIILWNIDPLLENGHEIRSYTIVVVKYWIYKQRPLLGNDNEIVREREFHAYDTGVRLLSE